MDERIFEIILALIPFLGTIITVFIVPFIREKIGSEQLAKYKEWAILAVKAAEMIWTETGHGTEKKDYVVKFLNDMFNSKKIIITEQQIDILIESAVQELNKDKMAWMQ